MKIIKRHFWIDLISKLWQKKSILLLYGVRRVGKTFLCKSLPNIIYFDCELPRTRMIMEDPESFLSNYKGKKLIIDEIHRLANPSQLLKIAADYFPDIKIIATGSSSIGASAKFKDTLTGRKLEVWLTPMISKDNIDFGKVDIKHRLEYGGLPPFFLSKEYPEREFQEWMDAYWAKDIQELFRLERRYSFQRFMELLFIQSGGIFEASKFATTCEVSRTTINNYLAVLESTLVVNIIQPFSEHRSTEIVSAPKVYAFDTGFVFYFKGLNTLRAEDLGLLWEHYVLNEINARLQTRNIFYWRDKRHHEIDFVLRKRTGELIAVECKWSANNFDFSNIKAFRKHYPIGSNFAVCNDISHPLRKKYKGIIIDFVNLENLIKLLSSH